MKRPRDYQEDAHWATWSYLHDRANHTGGKATGGQGPKAPLVVEATGLGKSLNIAMLIYHLKSKYPSVRIMQLCHVKELVQGNYMELLSLWPSAPAGVYAAGLKQKDTKATITYAMINSVAKRAATFGHVDFVFIDEAHRLTDNDATLYGAFLKAVRERNPNMITVGYTATDYRMKGGRLTDMAMFDDVVYNIGAGETFLWAVDEGYLIMPVPVDPGFKVDESSISLSGGDYKESEASAALREQDIIERAVDYSIEIARDQGRKCNLAFAQSIEDAELIADMYSYKGWPTEAVHSKRSDRDEVLRDYRAGKLWGVANKDILTTGFNNPLIDMMTVLRLTRSPGLWVQMVGRTTRPVFLPGYDITTKEGRINSILASHKQNAIVLDFVGNTERLGPINYPRIPGRRGCKGGGDAPVRTCPDCDPPTYHHVSTSACPFCGYEWPVSSAVSDRASSAELVSVNNPLGLPAPKKEPKAFEVYSVHQLVAARHAGKNGKPDTMRVDYRCGFRRFSVWICMEHEIDSFPRDKAELWWDQHDGLMPVPANIDEALERIEELSLPRFIKVWVNTKYPEIEAYDFKGSRFEGLKDLNAEPEIFEPEADPMAKDAAEQLAADQKIASAFKDTGYYGDDEIPF